MLGGLLQCWSIEASNCRQPVLCSPEEVFQLRASKSHDLHTLPHYSQALLLKPLQLLLGYSLGLFGFGLCLRQQPVKGLLLHPGMNIGPTSHCPPTFHMSSLQMQLPRLAAFWRRLANGNRQCSTLNIHLLENYWKQTSLRHLSSTFSIFLSKGKGVLKTPVKHLACALSSYFACGVLGFNISNLYQESS